MVKKKVGGGKRYQAAVKAKAKDGGSTGTTPQWEGPAPPKHLQRKIARKVNFLDKVAASKSASLAAKSVISKKRKVSTALTDLTSLGGAVNELLQQHQHQQLLPASGKAGRKRSKAHKAAGQGGEEQRVKQFGEAVGTLRARAAVMAKESARTQKVVQHPLYQQDPIQAITNHLNATLPPAPAPPPMPKPGGKRKKKGGKKNGAGDGSAEMEQ